MTHAVTVQPEAKSPGPAGRWTGRRADFLALAAIAGVFALGWMLVAPWSNVPVIDDWCYAWSDQQLLKTGHLLVCDRSSIYPIVQILWGSLFARAFGFSFGVLRLSTVVLSVCGCWGVYGTLRELECSTKISLLGALTVALYPAYFVLSFTFMTDVPFVSLSAIALFFYVSGIRRDRPGRLWCGALFAVLAFLVRQVGVVLPIAVFAALDRRSLTWAAARRVWLPLTTGVVAIVACWFALPAIFGRLPVIDRREGGLQWLLELSAGEYSQSTLEVLWVAVFPLAPLLMCQWTRPRRALTIGLVAIALAAGMQFTFGAIPEPLGNGQTWSLQDLAQRTSLIDGDLDSTGWTAEAVPFLRGVTTVLVASGLVGLWSLRRRDPRLARVLIAGVLLELALINLTWTSYDRYALLLVPLLALLAAIPLSDRRLPLWPALVVLSIWAFIGITGTRDVLTTNAVAAAIARDLEGKGIRPIDIDAGYALNAWRMYVHPENLPPGADPHDDVPFVSTDQPARYKLVTQLRAKDVVLRTERLPAAIWQVTDHLYLVRSRE